MKTALKTLTLTLNLIYLTSQNPQKIFAAKINFPQQLPNPIPNCRIYDRIQQLCIQCQDTYYPVLPGKLKCLPCGEGCGTCNDQTYCRRCLENFYLENSLCYSCPKTCKTCKNFDNCFTCKNGFVLIDGKQCLRTTDNSQLIFNIVVIVCILLVIGAICYAAYQNDRKTKGQIRLKERLIKNSKKTVFGSVGLNVSNGDSDDINGFVEDSLSVKMMDKDEKTVRMVAKKLKFKEDLGDEFSLSETEKDSLEIRIQGGGDGDVRRR